jgi:hypothetical protein
VALALDRAATGALRLVLRTVPMLAAVHDGPAGRDESLATLAATLDRAGRTGVRPFDCDGCLWTLRLGWGALVTLERDAAGLTMPEPRRIAA